MSEPPGEPYYIARIMEFIYEPMKDNTDENNTSLTNAETVRRKVKSFRVNWFYRPRDIQKSHTDSRILFATMHSDICPAGSFRGKCNVVHRSHFECTEDEFRRMEDNFWFDRLFDRYIHRFYDVLPTENIRNVPNKVLEVLQDRWSYVIAEPTRARELCEQTRACRRCLEWCATAESVRCAVCSDDYHLRCLKPPLPRKPSKGFAWTCVSCWRAHMTKLREERKNLSVPHSDGENGIDDHEDDPGSDSLSSLDSEDDINFNSSQPPPEDNVNISSINGNGSGLTRKPIAALWPYRYLGIHCRVEDALDVDDRINPRAASRVGPRHQANVLDWPGRPFEMVLRKVEKPKHKNQFAPKEEISRDVWEIECPSGYSKESNNSAERC